MKESINPASWLYSRERKDKMNKEKVKGNLSWRFGQICLVMILILSLLISGLGFFKVNVVYALGIDQPNQTDDYGDAPAPYPTTNTDNGAHHLAIGPTLGTNRDAELDGQPTSNADGDDTTGTPDDEDGVTFGTVQVGQLDATVTVNVGNAPSGAKLDAWIDFNQDGSWGGPGEQIFDSLPVTAGDNALNFDVPSWTLDGVTYARFRLSTAGDFGQGGTASDGEVEDHTLTITSPASVSHSLWTPNTITTTAFGARSVAVADLDGDGDLDVLSASIEDDKIAWYESDGGENFTAHTISTAADAVYWVAVADLDGDGDLDVLSASSYDDKIAWYENDGGENFTVHTITDTANSARSLAVADMDGDGDLDVLSASAQDEKIAWYDNDGGENFTAHTITASALDARSVAAADLDGDGDMDVISGSHTGVAWYENDGNQSFTTSPSMV